MLNFIKVFNFIIIIVHILLLNTNQGYSYYYPENIHRLRVPMNGKGGHQGRTQLASNDRLASNPSEFVITRMEFLLLSLGMLGHEELYIHYLVKETCGYSDDTIEEMMPHLRKLFVKTRPLKESVAKAKEEYKKTSNQEKYINTTKEIIKRAWDLLLKEGHINTEKPSPLIRLLVNGLDPNKGEDIFDKLKNARQISSVQRKKIRQKLISCSAISQLEYLLFRYLDLEVREGFGRDHVLPLVVSGNDRYIFADVSFDVYDADFRTDYAKEGERPVYVLQGRYGMPPKEQSFIQQLFEQGRFEQNIKNILNLHCPYIYIGNGKIGFSSSILGVLSRAYGELGETKMALACADKAIERHNEDYEAYFVRGAVWPLELEFFKAEKDYKTALRFNPRFAKAYYGLGLVNLVLDNLQEAVVNFKKALELEPENPAYRGQHRDVMAQVADCKVKSALSEKQLILEPNNANLLHQLIFLFYKLGEYENARRVYEGKYLTPPTSGAYRVLGGVYYKLGELTPALYSWAMAYSGSKDPKTEVLPYIPDEHRNEVLDQARKIRAHTPVIPSITAYSI